MATDLTRLTPADVCLDYAGGGDQLVKQLEAGRVRLADFDAYQVMALGDVLRPKTIKADGSVLDHRAGDAAARKILDDHRARAGLPPLMYVTTCRLYRAGSQWGGVEGPRLDLSSLAGEQDAGLLGVHFARWCTSHGIAIDGFPATNPYALHIDFPARRAVVNSQVMSLASVRWLSALVNYLAECRAEFGFAGVLLDAPKWQWTYPPFYYGTADQGDYVANRGEHLLTATGKSKQPRWLAPEIVLVDVPPGGPSFKHHDYWRWDCRTAMVAWNYVATELRRRDPQGLILSAIRGFDQREGGGPSSCLDRRALIDVRRAIGPLEHKGADLGWCTQDQALAWVENQLAHHASQCDWLYPPGSRHDDN